MNARLRQQSSSPTTSNAIAPPLLRPVAPPDVASSREPSHGSSFGHDFSLLPLEALGPRPTTRLLQRKKDPAAPPKQPPPPPMASAPKLSLKSSKNGTPCACLIVIHNDERAAHKTASLMHEHCAYNLALVEPDTGNRLVKIPKRGTVDPNSLFTGEVAEACTNDEQACRDLLTNKAQTTKASEIQRLVETQFFLAISDCSSKFSLPVVALHNNDIEDTKKYLAKKDQVGVADLKTDIDKTDPKTGADDVKKLKELLEKKFGPDVTKPLIDTPQKTNIFRLCTQPDLKKCHVGDPDRPDTVTWVTNPNDFDTLKTKNVNVVLQSDIPTSGRSESKGDLSTLFLILRDLLLAKIGALFEAAATGALGDVVEIIRLVKELVTLLATGDLTVSKTVENLRQMGQKLIDMIARVLKLGDQIKGPKESIEKLRYLNIETPGLRMRLTDADRQANFDAIAEVLKSVNLFCCGDDPKAAEKKVKEGLKEPAESKDRKEKK